MKNVLIHLRCARVSIISHTSRMSTIQMHMAVWKVLSTDRKEIPCEGVLYADTGILSRVICMVRFINHILDNQVLILKAYARGIKLVDMLTTYNYLLQNSYWTSQFE